MPRKLLARFQFLSESDKYLDLLEKNGIAFYLSGLGIEQEGQTNYNEHLEVWVDEENFNKAVLIIKQDDYFTACPKCDSKDLGEAIMENMKSNLNPLLKIFGGFHTNALKSGIVNYKCNNCGHIFQ